MFSYRIREFSRKKHENRVESLSVFRFSLNVFLLDSYIFAKNENRVESLTIFFGSPKTATTLVREAAASVCKANAAVLKAAGRHSTAASV